MMVFWAREQSGTEENDTDVFSIAAAKVGLDPLSKQIPIVPISFYCAVCYKRLIHFRAWVDHVASHVHMEERIYIPVRYDYGSRR